MYIIISYIYFRRFLMSFVSIRKTSFRSFVMYRVITFSKMFSHPVFHGVLPCTDHTGVSRYFIGKPPLEPFRFKRDKVVKV